jgi:hypothetical protein
LQDGLALLDFDSLFAPSRLATSESLELARRTAAAAEGLVAVYRAEEVQIDAGMAPEEFSLREPARLAALTDSLFATVDTLYGLLGAAEGAVTVRGPIVAFQSLALATEFTRRAAWVQAQRQVWQVASDGTPPVIATIVGAVGRVPQARTNF